MWKPWMITLSLCLNFLISFSQADLDGALLQAIKNNDLQAVELLLHQGAEMTAFYKEVPVEDQVEYIINLNNHATLMVQMGDISRALPLCQVVLDYIKDSAGETHPDYISSLEYIAALHDSVGDYSNAILCYEDALPLNREVYGPESSEYALNLTRLAELYLIVGRYREAIPLYEEILTLTGNIFGPDHPVCLAIKKKLAKLYQKMGDFASAMILFQETGNIIRNEFGEKSEEYARNLNNLAMLYLEMGNSPRALPLLLEATAIIEHSTGVDNPEYGTYLNNLASIYLSLGKDSLALELFKESLDNTERMLGKGHPNYARCLDNMAGIYQDRGDYDEALPLCQEALAIIQNTFGEDNLETARAMNNLGMVYQDMKDYSEALKMFENASSIFEHYLGQGHMDYAVTLNNLADCYHALHNYSMALKYYTMANETINMNIRENFTFQNELEKKYYFNTTWQAYVKYISFMYETRGQYTDYPGQIYSNELLQKGMILSALSATKKSILFGNDTALIERFEQLSSLKRQLTGLQQVASSEDDLDRLADLGRQVLVLESELSLESRNFVKMQQQFSVSPGDVGVKLGENEAAIEFVSFRYYNGRYLTDSTLYGALVMRHDDVIPRFVYLSEEKDIREGLPGAVSGEAGINLAYHPSRGIGTLQRDEGSFQSGPDLYPLIWEPLDSLLTGITTVYYAPSGLLHSIAFAAIACPDSVLLLERYTLVQLSSTRSLAISGEADEIQNAAIYGGITYEMDEGDLSRVAQRNATLPESDLAGDDFAPVRGSGHGFQYLEGTRQEAEIVGTEFRKKGIAVISYTGHAAMEESFASLSGMESPSVIHIATHGFYLPDTISSEQNRDLMMRGATGEERFRFSDDPLLRSGLVLADANAAWRGEPIPAGLEDGILTAKEVSNMNLLNTQLVVLSACQTGLGDVKGSEGVEGLLRGFKMAGVRYLILSLWEVPDKETVEFMQRFYGNWLGGQEIRTAFRNTQRQMHARYPDEPYKWAAFVLVE